jgi:hypothetical protein
VALWLVIDPCVNFGRVYCDFWYIYFIPQFFETPDDGLSPKVQFVQVQICILC